MLVRADLAAAHDRAWAGLGQPGTHLTAAERVAAAAHTRAARTCALCIDIAGALSPMGHQGEHEGKPGPLSPAMIDVVHRLTMDAGRLSQSWQQALGLDPAVYVELLGVAVQTIGIDSFSRAAGLPLRSLPTPTEGEPTRTRPEDATDDAAWVPMRRLRGQPNIVRALSLVPDEQSALWTVVGVEYIDGRNLLDMAADPGRAIDRAQIELIAARVSALNGCFY
jgi:alkylhydroperoxidase family enzyme